MDAYLAIGFLDWLQLKHGATIADWQRYSEDTKEALRTQYAYDNSSLLEMSNLN